MSRHIIGLVGRQGSGKGTAAKILAEKYGAQLFRFSAILGDVLDRVAVERTRDNMIKISEALRATFGEDVLAYAIEKDAINSTSDIVVIDGIRRIEDIAALEPLPQFKLVEISAPAKVRYDRMTHRGEKSGENEMTWDEFAEQEQAPTELSIPSVAARAWKAIDNDGSAEELTVKIDAMMQELG
ncbi:AAA family ATPase [Patescibacteria group bacterium]|jgi:dephospho-CoA kinase|nr:AAA family ATPase [Patescibacteria group bacterium]